MREDDDLTHLLAQATDPQVATPDSFREVLVRYRKGRTRALAAALVAVALLGPAAGIAVGRATADHPTQVATGASPDTADSGSSGTAGSSGGSGRVTESRSAGSIGSFPQSQIPPAPKRLFVRTTTDGVTMRVYLQDDLPVHGKAECATDQGPVPCPSPPPGCAPPSTQLQVGLSNEGAVDPGYVPIVTTDTPGSLVVLQASYFGVMEGDPTAWAAVKADAGVARVRVRFSDGATDEMAPVDGYAVFAHRTAAPAPLPAGPPSSPEEFDALVKASMPQGSVDALDATGAVLSTTDLAATPTGPFSRHCAIEGEPKPLLPDGESIPPASPAVPATRP